MCLTFLLSQNFKTTFGYKQIILYVKVFVSFFKCSCVWLVWHIQSKNQTHSRYGKGWTRIYHLGNFGWRFRRSRWGWSGLQQSHPRCIRDPFLTVRYLRRGQRPSWRHSSSLWAFQCDRGVGNRCNSAGTMAEPHHLPLDQSRIQSVSNMATNIYGSDSPCSFHLKSLAPAILNQSLARPRQ